MEQNISIQEYYENICNHLVELLGLIRGNLKEFQKQIQLNETAILHQLVLIMMY